MIRAAAVAIALAAALVAGVPAGQAADECKGLMVCIPVAGPWVKIPRPAARFRERHWRLVCPRGVVGGVDARASEPAVAVEFPGRIGSPVNPGITTTRSLVFKGTYAGRVSQSDAYRPFIGCIPGGGGGPRTPTALTRASAVKPGEPITVRVATLNVQAGSLARTTLGCRPASACCAAATASVSTRRPCRRRSSSPRSASCARRVVSRCSSARPGGRPARRRAGRVQIQAECAR